MKYEYPEFYFVWTKKGHVPRKTHTTGEKAMKEAERLAKLHPGRKFIVLKAVTKVSVDAPEREAA